MLSKLARIGSNAWYWSALVVLFLSSLSTVVRAECDCDQFLPNPSDSVRSLTQNYDLNVAICNNWNAYKCDTEAMGTVLCMRLTAFFFGQNNQLFSCAEDGYPDNP